MERLLRYGGFGFFYGSRLGVAFGGAATLWSALNHLMRLPSDEITGPFFVANLIFVLASVVVGFIFGSIGGYVFGLLGSLARSPWGWGLSGMVGGSICSCLLMWAVWLSGRSVEQPNFMLFLLQIQPMAIIPCVVLSIVGWVVGFAVRDGRPNIPLLERIRGQ